jgi:hypothetical protein
MGCAASTSTAGVSACRIPSWAGASGRSRATSAWIASGRRRSDISTWCTFVNEPACCGASSSAVVDVYLDGVAPPRVVRLDPDAASAGDAGPASRFRPELALSAKDGLVAACGFGLQVHDYRRGVRVSLGQIDAQKLAPGAP